MHSDSAVSNLFFIHNGILREAGAANVLLTDGALARGQGAFETIAAYRGRPFLVTAHLERLRHAAVRLDLDCPGDAEVIAAMETLLAGNQLTGEAKARLRLTLTSPPAGGPSWWLEAGPVPLHREHARVITIPYTRNERCALAGLKTINYGANVVAMRLAQEAGADEALFSNTRDELCEGTLSNIFVYRDGSWLTPPLSSGCLPGITRALILQLARELGLGIQETEIPLGDLTAVEAGFLTSSLREIQPISSIDGRELGDSPDLSGLREAYARLVAAETGHRAT